MIVVDTSVWIGYFRNHDRDAVHALRALPRNSILVGDAVLLEILQGERTEALATRLEVRLRELRNVSMLGQGVAVEAARHYRALRALGITVRSSVDTIVATYCIRHGHQLLHDDRDFDAFETHLGLQVYRPH